MNKKGYLHLSYMIAGTVLIITVAFVIWVALTSSQTEDEGFDITERKLGEMTIMNKLITSRECLSTGETGILNQTLLDEAELTPDSELPCALLPNFGHYVMVDNLTNGDGWDWEFGYKNEYSIGKYKYFDFPVAIKNHDGSATPGRMRLGIIHMSNDIMVQTTYLAENSWFTLDIGQKKSTLLLYKDMWLISEIKIDNKKICFEGFEKNMCRDLEYAELMEKEISISDVSMQHAGGCKVTFQKKIISGEIKLEPLFECV
ncbi:MAG: hypothetical protein JSV92_01070 [archaeon]|nr:MAG: hypothetical protein JSV92_01070 [archaeon]